MAHVLIACKSIQKGMTKIVLRQEVLEKDLDRNWAVLAEAIQNILRRENYPKPYEALLNLTRGKPVVTKEDLHHFIDTLNISSDIKDEMRELTPSNYTGYL
jgi:adenylosuccinate lyase